MSLKFDPNWLDRLGFQACPAADRGRRAARIAPAAPVYIMSYGEPQLLGGLGCRHQAATLLHDQLFSCFLACARLVQFLLNRLESLLQLDLYWVNFCAHSSAIS